MFKNRNVDEELQLRHEIEEAMKKLVNKINQDLHDTLLLPHSGIGEGECNKQTFSRIIALCRFMEDEASTIRRSIEKKLSRINSDLLRTVTLPKK